MKTMKTKMTISVSKKNNERAMGYFEKLIVRKKANKRYSTAELYGVALHEFLRAIGLEERDKEARLKDNKQHPELKFTDFTRANLETFDEGMTLRGISVNAANTYWSNLRAMFHRAEIEGIIDVSKDPFRYRKIKMVMPHKETLEPEEIVEISKMDLSKEPKKEESRDINDFCFLAQGMPYIDAANLTRANLTPKQIVYQRVKTNMTVIVERTPAINKLLTKYMTTGHFLFPIIKGDVFDRNQYRTSLRAHNERMKSLGEQMEVPRVITSYTVRHSWAMAARRKGVSLSAISASLGHASERTTLHYLKGIDLAIVAKANRVVTKEVGKSISERF